MHRLRGHHLICMCQFQGLGYNETFADHMSHIINELKQDSSSQIIPVTHMDDICSACPNRLSDTVCAVSKEDECPKKDSLVLETLHLTQEEAYSYSEILTHIKENTDAVYDVCCKGCRWEKKGICSKKLFKDNLNI